MTNGKTGNRAAVRHNTRPRQSRRETGKRARPAKTTSTIRVRLSDEPGMRRSLSFAAPPTDRLARRSWVELERDSAHWNSVGQMVVAVVDGTRCPISVGCLAELAGDERTALGLNRRVLGGRPPAPAPSPGA